MKKAIFAMILLAGSAFAGPRFSFGIGFGAPAVVVARPMCPGPGYVWVDGYWGPDRVWIPGFWRAPAVVVGPRFGEPHYFAYEHGRRDFRRYR